MASFFHPRDRFYPLVEVLHIKSETMSAYPLGEMIGGSLRLKGYLF